MAREYAGSAGEKLKSRIKELDEGSQDDRNF